MKKLIARWESRNKKYHVDLYQYGIGIGYSGTDSGGYWSTRFTQKEAIEEICNRVKLGEFGPVKRVDQGVVDELNKLAYMKSMD